MRDKIILVGGGGHCKVIIESVLCAELFDIVGIIDPNISVGSSILGVSVIGGDEKISALYAQGISRAFICVGSVGDCSVRKKLANDIHTVGYIFPAIIHPLARISRFVSIGEGTFVAVSATVGTDVTIGRNVIINTSASVDHDSRIGDFVHVAPGVTVCGGVTIGNETHIGAGATVIEGIQIGNGCFVKAGTIVKKDLDDGERFTGE